MLNTIQTRPAEDIAERAISATSGLSNFELNLLRRHSHFAEVNGTQFFFLPNFREGQMSSIAVNIVTEFTTYCGLRLVPKGGNRFSFSLHGAFWNADSSDFITHSVERERPMNDEEAKAWKATLAAEQKKRRGKKNGEDAEGEMPAEPEQPMVKVNRAVSFTNVRALAQAAWDGFKSASEIDHEAMGITPEFGS